MNFFEKNDDVPLSSIVNFFQQVNTLGFANYKFAKTDNRLFYFYWSPDKKNSVIS